MEHVFFIEQAWLILEVLHSAPGTTEWAELVVRYGALYLWSYYRCAIMRFRKRLRHQ